PVSVEPTVIITGKGVAPRFPQTVETVTSEGYTKSLPAKFEKISPDLYAQTGEKTIKGYVLYGEDQGLPLVTTLKIKDGASVDGVLNDEVWRSAAKHEIGLLSSDEEQTPYYPVSAEFMAYAGEEGVYFAFNVKDTKIVNNYQSTLPLNQRPFDWDLYLNDGVEIYIHAGEGGLSEKSFAVYLTASGLLRVYAPNSSRNGWSGVNLYNNQADNVKEIVRSVKINGTPNKPADRDDGYVIELFVPYRVFGTKDADSLRIAAVVRSRADVPGGIESLYGVYCNGGQSAFSKIDPTTWIRLSEVL
ncbi:MAG: sugar-binding protein, partial [Candidatus Gallimonas sp.]